MPSLATRSLKALGTYNFAGDIGKMIFPAAAALMFIVLPWRQALMILGALGVSCGGGNLCRDAEISATPRPRHERTISATRDVRCCTRPFAFPLLLSVGVIDSATRMAFLTFLPFVLTAKGASVQVVGLALTLVFVGGAMGKLVCAFIGARIGAVATVWLTETVTALGIVSLLPLSLEAALMLLPVVGIALNGTSSVLYGSVPDLVEPAVASARFQHLLYGDDRCRRRFAGNLWVAGRCGRHPGGAHGRCCRRADNLADHACLAAGPCGAAILTSVLKRLDLSHDRCGQDVE